MLSEKPAYCRPERSLLIEIMTWSSIKRDYSLVGDNALRALQEGLAEATWYTSPVPKEDLRTLLERRNGPAIRDTIIWFALLLGSGVAGYVLWQAGSGWAAAAFLIYGMIYGSTSDSRWHESGHGTAFRTEWLNNALYEIASFMVMRESVPWRWSHTRHHSDTIIVGRDPEIAFPRPPDVLRAFLAFFSLHALPKYWKHVLLHSFGRITAEEKTYIPESEYSRVFARARVYVAVYAGVIGLAIYHGSILPLMFVGLPNLYGAWLMPIYGNTQHAGLAENVLDHRLNCRTVYMNLVNRYLYWNMNYHVEHHMFPLVPYHNLPRLHELVKGDMPPAYQSTWHAWRELVPAVWRQLKDPSYYVERKLPSPSVDGERHRHGTLIAKGRVVDGWAEVCVSGLLRNEDVVRCDHEAKTYAIYRSADGRLFATDGLCTHARAHLADGFVQGTIIECPKHNGRFDFSDGSPRRKPVCVALQTYEVRERDGKIFLNVEPQEQSEKHDGEAPQRRPEQAALLGPGEAQVRPGS